MKSIQSLIKTASLCAVIAIGAPMTSALIAQTNAPESTTATTSATDDKGEKHHGSWSKLTPEERTRLKAAHDAAMKDPSVVAAKATRDSDREGYRKLVREAMLKADPTIAPLLDRVQKSREDFWKTKTANLTSEEKKKLHDAHRAAMKDPAVVAARDDIKKANGKDEKKAAWKKFREANRDAMIKADPSVADILKKMHQSTESSD